MKKTIGFLLALIVCLSVLTACGENSDVTAYVESVASITGYSSLGGECRYAGVVTARDTVDVQRDSSKKVSELLVEVGDEVKEGQTLFTYDMEQMELDLQKARLEIEQLQNSLETMKEQKEELEEDREYADESDKLAYTVQIQELETNIKETEYQLKSKDLDIQNLEGSTDIVDVTSPVNGTIQSINENGYDSAGNPAGYIVLMEMGSFRVKGIVSELNAGNVYEGMEVTIRSRGNEELTWGGTISFIDWEKPISGNNNYYYASDEMTTASKYPFYVELESTDGLLLGQHIYIEPYSAQGGEGLWLPEWYICELEGKPWVWAQSEKTEKLEKRRVELGEYNAENGTYQVLSGLGPKDNIAFPDDTLSEGMSVTVYEQEEPFPDSGDVWTEPVTDAGDDLMWEEEALFEDEGMYYGEEMDAVIGGAAG